MKFIDHLQQSAEQLFPLVDGKPDGRHGAFVESFEITAPGQPRRSRLKLGRHDPRLVLTTADRLLKSEGFDTHGGPDILRGTLQGRLNQDFEGGEGWLAWAPRNRRALRLVLDIRLELKADSAILYTSQQLPSWVRAFERRMNELLSATPEHVGRLLAESSPDPAPVRRETVLAPGQQLDPSKAAGLLDYSGCAEVGAVADLQLGNLPLGRYAFGFADEEVFYGPDLFLGTYRTGAAMMYNGALICAPQNSGKTRLILRWAKAANALGFSVLLVDVKGNLFEELGPELSGRVRHFTTDPRIHDCDGLNFLSGLGRADAESLQRTRQLVDAILPREGWEAGEQAYFHQNHVNWLTGLIQILLLYQHYYPTHFVGGEADLSLVYEMAAGEAALYRVMNLVKVAELGVPEPRRPDLAHWASEIALLVSPDNGGQRTADYSYRTLTQSITNALRPFSEFGTLFEKTSRGRPWRPSARPERDFFTLDALNDPAEPVTIILAAREQDVDDAATVVSMVVKRLQHTLFDRMGDGGAGRPILLLLDETRRIRSFAPDEYITFARQARTCCVVVYQSLDQIGDDKKIRVILENVGVQIYLGSVVGETARHLVRMLPQRRRQTATTTLGGSLSGDVTSSVQTSYETVDYLGAAELYRLPGGSWPALVYLNSQPRRDPILVDIDEGLAVASHPEED